MFCQRDNMNWPAWLCRCFKLLSLQAHNLTEGCLGPAPFYVPHFKVELLEWKGWQNEKGYDGPREGASVQSPNDVTYSPCITACIYDIYQQPIPEMDMHSHLLRWKAFLKTVIGRKLALEDYVFPHIVNGVIRTDRQMSYNSLQGMLTEFCQWSETQKRYTTHSFRWGGAQYRFMYAPIGQWWSLNQIWWWGGWAVGEHVHLKFTNCDNFQFWAFLLVWHIDQISRRLTLKLWKWSWWCPPPNSNWPNQFLHGWWQCNEAGDVWGSSSACCLSESNCSYLVHNCSLGPFANN